MTSIASIPLSDIFEMSIVTALLLSLGHYFPWHDIFGRPADGRPMPRIPAYVYGVLAIILPVIYLFMLSGSRTEAVLLVANVIVAGAATVLCYVYDQYRTIRRTAKESLEREKQLADRLSQLEDGNHSLQ